MPLAVPPRPYNLQVSENCFSCVMREEGLFCQLPERVLSQLNSLRQNTFYPRGAVLFVEGEAPRGIFILCSGQAKVLATSPGGNRITLRLVEQGEVLGLSNTVSNEPYPITAETLSPCQVSFIPRLGFLQLLRASPDVSLRVAKHLSMELHKAWDQTRLLALSPGTQVRFVQFLQGWAQQHGQVLSEGTRLALNMTHEEIGASIGASRETVSRILGDLKRRELIRIVGGSITILQPHQLLGLIAGPPA